MKKIEEKQTITNKADILALMRASQLKSEKVTIDLNGQSITLLIKELTGEDYIRASERAMNGKVVDPASFYLHAVRLSCFMEDGSERIFDNDDAIELLKGLNGDVFSKLVAVVGRLNNLVPN